MSLYDRTDPGITDAIADADGRSRSRVRLLTAREVAAQLSVSTETVLRWTRRGRLPGFRLPSGALRYRQADLNGWLTERATHRRGGVGNPVHAGRPDNLAGVSHPR
jgi:excisionase family DNA binding protein